MRILLPKRQTTLDHSYGPLFFLAGPVRGADDWQTTCCAVLQKRLQNFYAALPCRYPPTHPLMKFRAEGVDDHFDRQQAWERHYLEMAAQHGCIVFWLPCESVTNPRRSDGPYARDTYGELGEWRGRAMHEDVRMVVGAEEGFPGLSQIRRNFEAALGEFTIYPTLDETVAAAVEIAVPATSHLSAR